ncbi:tRNA synthetases class II-domain-containing protein [Phaeosphaeriaceae sp. PMI808]|nr:tRNA synthetases class II-domain-containing protein [Phaeosphaeriaceae sp. PMI808]
MGLIHIAKQGIGRGTCLRNSYVEISRFFCTRNHGITFNRAITFSGERVRSFSTSRAFLNAIEPDEKLRKTLNDFKASFRSTPWSQLTEHWTNQETVDQDIEIGGYLSTRRDVNKNLTFTMLRNKAQSACIQLVSSSNVDGKAADAHLRLRSLREWTPVVIRGKIKARSPAKSTHHLGMKLVIDREIMVEHVEPLNELSSDNIIKEDTAFGPEHRHLQLRTNSELRESILFRAKVSSRAKIHLNDRDWKEIETPILFKSTPEGAREFLVPTRQKGLAYALPQSPQQYKQILMASGFNKYYQFARCFRDEDLRADRQPEFTQLDMEMSWADENDVMAATEMLIRALWHRGLRRPLPEAFPRMIYQEAMSSYGSDKPDLRFKAKIHTITHHLPADLISKITSLKDPAIDAFKISISSDPKVTRKFITSFLDSPDGKPYLDNPHGQPGIFVGDSAQPMQGLGPLGYQYVMEGPGELSVDHGDLLVVQARPDTVFSGGSTVFGNLRLALHKAAIAQGLLETPDPKDHQFVWIIDFPLFTPNNDSDPGQGGTAGFSSTHHPFTAPKTPNDVDLLLTDPSLATAAHYDLVLNGIELGGGSRRIHNAAVQEFIFRDVLKMQPDRIEDFRHLLDALGSGCPPHAGIAIGWDRLIAVMRGKESVRDVIAFPKGGRGEDPMVKSPNRVTQEQLDTYHMTLKE